MSARDSALNTDPQTIRKPSWSRKLGSPGGLFGASLVCSLRPAAPSSVFSRHRPPIVLVRRSARQFTALGQLRAGSALDAFPEGLCVCNSKGQLAGGSDWVDFVANRIDRSSKTFEVIGFIEPLIALTDGLVDCDSEVDRGQPQWSRR